MIRRAALLLLVLLLAGASRSREPSAENELAPPLSAWRGGPVSYLLTAEEERAVRKLTDEGDLRAFIEQFWARRDPTPGTPENENRDLFWRRVAEADRLFVETTKQGWKTDRGRFYILFGPPDEQDLDPMMKGGRGSIRWTYRASRTREGGPNQIIAFREDASGEYRLSSNPRDYTLVPDFVTRPSLSLGVAADVLTARARAAGLTQSQLQSDLDGLADAAREEDVVAALVAGQAPAGARPLVDRFDFFRAQDGTTYVAIGVGVRRSFLPDDTDAASVLPVARLESLDRPGSSVDFVYRNPFVPGPGNDRVPAAGYLAFHAGRGVDPGRYRVYVGVFDRASGVVASRREELDVPAFSDAGLQVSSLTLVDPTDGGAPTGPAGPSPFVLAGRPVLPRLDPTLRNGDTFALYYQVYGAAHGPDGRPSLEVEYRFSVVDGATTTPVGDPIRVGPLQEQALGWEFPLRGWPAGSYQLQVTVRDRVAPRSAGAQMDFQIAG
jgi:GWxTD domain-containing protein